MEENHPVFDLEIDESASRSLIDAAGWARFIAIFSFVAMGCFLIIVFAFQDRISYRLATFIPGMDQGGGIGFLVAVILIVFLILSVILVFLLRGAILIKRGIEGRSQQELVDGLRSLKIYFTIYGVLSILGVVFNLIGLLFK